MVKGDNEVVNRAMKNVASLAIPGGQWCRQLAAMMIASVFPKRRF
jgi:hypothetical protein